MTATWAPPVQPVSLQPPIWGDPNEMFTIANELIKDAENYAAALTTQAQQLAAPTVNVQLTGIPGAPKLRQAAQPSLIDVTWNIPVQPGSFVGTLEIGNLFPAAFGVTPPTLSFGQPPIQFQGTIPDKPAVDLNFTYPTVAVDLPTIPSLLQLDAVTFDAAAIPTFDVTVPTLTLVAPSVQTFTEAAQFTSTLLTQITTDLTNALSEGTWTGLPGEIEVNLFDRARDREYRQQADALAALDRDHEVLGYAFPPGIWLDARIKIQTETAYTIDTLSREIMVKQAELTLQNITEARKTAVELESKLIEYANQVQQRAFDTAKYITEASISIYNAGVQAYGISLRAYEVQATVYDTQIKGILANVEIIKAHIAFEETKAQINTALVEQYKSQVQASLAVIEIYKAQIEIIQTQASVEKIKVDIYGAEIQAFASTVNAYTAEVEAYKAQAETQGVIESVYKTQAEVFATQVDAAAKQADALIAQYRGKIEAYTAQLEGFKAAITSMVGQAEAASKYNIAQAEVFKAEAVALSSYNDTLTKQWESFITDQIQAGQLGVAASKANGDLYIATRGLSLDASKVAAQVSAQLGAASLGAIHWSNSSAWSISNANSASNSSANSGSYITSDSRSTSA